MELSEKTGMGNRYTDPSPFRKAFVGILDFIAGSFNSLAEPWLPKFQGADITEHAIPLPFLEPAFDGYRLVQISDIHLGTMVKAEHLSEIVEVVNQLEPDTIAITGDFVSHTPEQFTRALVSSLSKLAAKDLKIAVLGNHDHWTSAKSIRSMLKACDILELRNTALKLQRGLSTLYFAGVDDHLAAQDQIQPVLDKIPQGKPAVLLAHEPDFADISAESGRFGLQISGHTHGGQILLPIIKRIILPPLGRKYPSGRYQINGMTLYTNRGIGTSWIQYRYKCTPEICVYILRSNLKDAQGE